MLLKESKMVRKPLFVEYKLLKTAITGLDKHFNDRHGVEIITIFLLGFCFLYLKDLLY